jgi:amino acid transporter
MADEKKDGRSVAIDQSSSSSDLEPGQVLPSSEDYGWNRGLSPRAVIMLSLGGGIGTGLWVGTGTALKAGMIFVIIQ